MSGFVFTVTHRCFPIFVPLISSFTLLSLMNSSEATVDWINCDPAGTEWIIGRDGKIPGGLGWLLGRNKVSKNNNFTLGSLKQTVATPASTLMTFIQH